MIEPPIVVDAKSELLVFRSAEGAAAYLEAIDVRNNEYPTAYDSKGRQLEVSTRFEERPFFFGLICRKLEVVGVRALEEEPNHAPELAQLLRTHLQHQHLNELSTASTSELLATAINRLDSPREPAVQPAAAAARGRCEVDRHGSVRAPCRGGGR